MRNLILAAIASLLAAAASQASAAPERLTMKPYPGAWKRITDKQGPNGWIHEQIPTSQSESNFTDILTDQGFVTLKHADPAAFLRNIFASVGGACDGAAVNGPKTAIEGGLPVAYGQVYCGTQKGQPFGVHIFYKAIGGADALYAVNREFHVPPSADGRTLSFPKGQEAQAMALLRSESAANAWLANSVYVCGGASTDKRCARR